MSNLNSLFDVVRGWTLDEKTSIEESFKLHSSVPSNDPIREGEIVVVETDGTVKRADAPDLSGLADTDALVSAMNQIQDYWMCIEGTTADEYSSRTQTGAVDANDVPGYQAWKAVCIKGTYMVETTEFVDRSGSGGYTPGDSLTVVSGQLDIIDSNNSHNVHHPKFAEVVEFDAATGQNGLMTAIIDN